MRTATSCRQATRHGESAPGHFSGLYTGRCVRQLKSWPPR